jgi:3-hydroxybutyryl-CoA dehydratase
MHNEAIHMLQVGATSTWERTFTEEDVRSFAAISGDHGIHHITPDKQGHLMVHGLLTATLPTKLGGDLNYIARELTFEFLRPIYVGDTIRCESIIISLESQSSRLKRSSTFTCHNQHGKKVLHGHSQGVILTLAEPSH